MSVPRSSIYIPTCFCAGMKYMGISKIQRQNKYKVRSWEGDDEGEELSTDFGAGSGMGDDGDEWDWCETWDGTETIYYENKAEEHGPCLGQEQARCCFLIVFDPVGLGSTYPK